MKTTFEQCTLGNIQVKNRIVRSATFEGKAENFKVSDAIVEMYEKLSQGGTGLIITGFFSFGSTDNPTPKTVTLTDDSCIDGLTKLAEVTHKNGCKIVAQLNHATSQIRHKPEGKIYGVSAVTDPLSGIIPEPFSTSQVKELIEEFAQAAGRVQQAGFDGVQIHAAHGYLFNKWLSPAFNKREDEYGGSIEQRAQVIVETLGAIKKRCGESFPVWIKLNCSDFEGENGVTANDFRTVAGLLADNGIDAIEVSGGTMAGEFTPARSKKYSAYHLEYAADIAKDLETAVILVGGLRSIDTIDEILSNTDIEAISLSRPLIREPDLAKRWMDGDRRDATCVACNGCFNPRGTKCYFTLEGEEKEFQKKMMQRMAGK